MKQSIWKKLTSLLLVAALLCSFGVTALADPGDPDPTPTEPTTPEFKPTVTLSADDVVHVGEPAEVTATVTPNTPEGWSVTDTKYTWTGAAGAGASAAVVVTGKTDVSVVVEVTYSKDGEATTTQNAQANASATIKAGYNVTATNGTGYTITVSPKTGLVEMGTNISATVEATTGYELVNDYTISPAVPFSLTGDVNLTASGANGGPVATKKTLTVNYNLLPTEGINQSPPAADTASYGAAFSFPTMTAKVETKNYHVDWYIGSTKASGLTVEQVNAYIESNTPAVTVIGQWVEEEATEFTVTLPGNGSNYTVKQTSQVPEGGKYPAGSVVTFTVTAAKGYKFPSSFGAIVNGTTPLVASISNGVASFSYTVGEENATISLSGGVEAVTLNITFDMNLTNGGKLRNAGTAKPAYVAPRSVSFDAITAMTPAASATLTAKAVDGGQTYSLKGWTASGASYGLSLSANELKAMVTGAKNPNADVDMILTANWDSSLEISAVLDFNLQTLAMSDTTTETKTSLYNQLSKAVTKDASYIKFSNLPSGRYAYGTLYEDSDMKGTVDTRTEYYLGASSSRYNSFVDIVFEPEKNAKNEDFVAAFDVYDSKGNVIDSGTMTINTGDEADIIWEMGNSDSIQFDEEDFDKFYSTRTIQLDSVTFEPDFTFGKTDGYVCYGGTASTDRMTERSFKNEEFYYNLSKSSKDKSLGELYYTIGSDDTGYRVFKFTCYDEKGKNAETGTLVIVLGGSGSKADSLDLVYNVKYDDTLTLDESDFYTFVGKNLSYVTFDVSDARGEFTVGTGKNADVLGDDLDNDTKFYYNSTGKRDLKISDIVYTPYSKSSRYTQYVDQVPFTAYSSNGRELKTGTLTICVVADSVPQVTISVDKGKTANFVPADFKTVAGKAVNASTGIDGVVLSTLPSTGTIYAGTGNTKASTGTTYSLDTKGTNLVSNLRYTATNKDGRYTATYLAYDGKELLYVGEILFDVGDHAIDAGKIYAVGAALPVTTLVKQAEEVLEKDFSYITITQPSNAIVYYNYKYINSNGGAVNSSTKYYYKATGSQQAMSSLTVVPYADRTSGESIDLVVTCYDEKDNETKLTVRYTYATASSAGFNDATAAWYKDSIYFLSNNKIVNGVSSTQYGVGTNIKRGDFILMLYRAFNLGSLTSQSSSFVDVKSSDYYAAAIGTAKALGITNGYEVNGQYYFYPEKSITREEAFALIYRTLTLPGVKNQMANSLPTAASSSLSSFRDGSSVQGYAQTAVAVLVKAQIVKGNDGKINPTNPISREEMAVILHRALTRY